MAATTGPTAALAGVPTGLQAQGVWTGRRQLFVRFAAEAETATMYTAQAIAQELKRAAGRSVFHSIAIGGRDPLSNLEFLQAALSAGPLPLPVMLDVDGQRPDGVKALAKQLALAQITLDGGLADAMLERAVESLGEAAAAGIEHAFVVAPSDAITDAQVLRVIERAHATSEKAIVVVHPPLSLPVDRDRRWVMLMEKACAVHRDTRRVLRRPPPTGTR